MEETGISATADCPHIERSSPSRYNYTPTVHHFPSRTARAAVEGSEWLSSVSLCGNTIPDTAHIVEEVDVSATPPEDGKPAPYRCTTAALVDTGATANFVSFRLVEKLGLSPYTVPADTATLGVDGRTVCTAQASRKCRVTLSYTGHLAHLSHISIDALVVDVHEYDLVLGLPWLMVENPEIDYGNRRLVGLKRHRRQWEPNVPVPADGSAGASPEGADVSTTARICMLSASQMQTLLTSREEAVEMVYLVKVEKLAICRGTTPPVHTTAGGAITRELGYASSKTRHQEKPIDGARPMVLQSSVYTR